MTRNILQTIEPSVIGERIAEARRERGLTQGELAESLGVARTTLIAMEKGDRRPRSTELVRLASLLDTPVRRFVEPSSAQVPLSFPILFRRKIETHGALIASDIGAFQQLCVWYGALEEELGEPLPRRYPPIYEGSDADPSRAAEEVASSERNRLGLGDGPIADIWGLLETDVGLRVVAFPMNDASVAGMFLFTESLGGCIAINAKHPPERQRWSAAHEFALFLADRHNADVTILRKRARLPRRERFADLFARSFLMPAAGVIRKFEGIRRSRTTDVTPADLLMLAHHYGVSFDSMMIRLEDLALVPGGTREYLKERGFKPNEGKRLLGLERTDRRALGPRRYLMLCAEAFQRDLLSEGQVAERLAMSLVDAREALALILSQSDVSVEGQWTQGSMDLTTSIAMAD